MKSAKSKNNFLPLRLVLSLILIVVISAKIEFNRFVNLLSSMDVSFFLLALLLAVLEKALLAYKWNILLGAKNISLPFVTIFNMLFKQVHWWLFTVKPWGRSSQDI